MKAVSHLQSILVKSSIDQLTFGKIKQAAGTMNEEQKKKDTQDAYMKFLCIKLEISLAKKNVCNDSWPMQVTENLFIGSMGAACHRDNLKEKGITHI
jgi:hypothetical protein